MTADAQTKQPLDSISQRTLHYQIDAELREEVRALREDYSELKIDVREIKDYIRRHENTVITMATLVHAGIAMRYIVVASIAMLSMVGGINIAYETIKKWIGHP